MKKNAYAIILASTLLTGCASIEDFRKMTPDERANMVCEADRRLRQLRKEKDLLTQSIQSSQEALSRGYRLHRECKDIEVYGDSTTVCKEIRGKTICKEHRPVSTRTECNDIPVAIDSKLEKENIRNWTKSTRQLDKETRSVRTACYSRIVKMTPEQAYEHY